MLIKILLKKNNKKIEQFIAELVVINITQEIKNKTIEVKKQNSLKLPDAIIAATSLVYQLPLLTSDKQFKTLEMLDLILYEG